MARDGGGPVGRCLHCLEDESQAAKEIDASNRMDRRRNCPERQPFGMECRHRPGIHAAVMKVGETPM
jgi:hypothetical protein